MLECVISIVLEGERIRVGDVIGEDHPLYEAALHHSEPRKYEDGRTVDTIFFTAPQKRSEASKPQSISDIARGRAFNPVFNGKGKKK